MKELIDIKEGDSEVVVTYESRKLKVPNRKLSWMVFRIITLNVDLLGVEGEVHPKGTVFEVVLGDFPLKRDAMLFISDLKLQS